ncbi:MAG: argininosuccinate lyase [Myxococcota bacterium]|jgi:argininosuccinate lyase
MALWDGRFSGGPAAEMQAYSESLSTDLLMWEEDIAGSVAHATMLGEVGLLSPDEVRQIHTGLAQVGEELRAGWKPGIDQEDVHMAVEGRLHALIGAPAGKLHTARSRNDQVATDVRLWLRSRLDRLDEVLKSLIGALCDRAESDGHTLVAGYTHLQRGQPIWLGHQLLAYAWSFSRDRERLADCRRRVNRSPLGAAAMAGTPHPIDRHRTAELLGFDGLVDNAMDAVSARDHVIESASVCAIVAIHLSRLAEELVLWSSREFGLIELSEAWSTGSSIMPQKRNPDAAELIRGKSGRVVGALTALLVMVKGLPMAYNRDLQEDRPALFDAIHTTIASTSVASGCISSMTIKSGPDLTGDPLLATELADFLASHGIPFREAHHVVGRIVRHCEEQSTNLAQLSLADFQTFHEAFTEEVFAWLVPEAAADRRTSHGGTAWSEVTRQITVLRAQL